MTDAAWGRLTDRENKIVCSPSALLSFREDPEVYKLRYIDKEKETNASMEFGTLVHLATLEPEKFEEQFSTLPEKTPENDLSTDELKAICKELEEKVTGTKRELAERIRAHRPEFKLWEELCDEMTSQGKNLLPPATMHKIKAIKAKIYSHPKVGEWLRLSEKEKRGYFTHKSGVTMPFLADAFFKHNGVGVVIDLKITKDWQSRKFMYNLFDNGYHIQAAAYLVGISEIENQSFNNFLFIAIEPKAPHRVRFYQLDQAAIEAGTLELNHYLNEFKERWQNKDFGPRMIDTQIQETSLAPFAWEKLGDMDND